jgi:hypothetical protein
MPSAVVYGIIDEMKQMYVTQLANSIAYYVVSIIVRCPNMQC